MVKILSQCDLHSIDGENDGTRRHIGYLRYLKMVVPYDDHLDPLSQMTPKVIARLRGLGIMKFVEAWLKSAFQEQQQGGVSSCLGDCLEPWNVAGIVLHYRNIPAVLFENVTPVEGDHDYVVDRKYYYCDTISVERLEYFTETGDILLPSAKDRVVPRGTAKNRTQEIQNSLASVSNELLYIGLPLVLVGVSVAVSMYFFR